MSNIHQPPIVESSFNNIMNIDNNNNNNNNNTNVNVNTAAYINNSHHHANRIINVNKQIQDVKYCSNSIRYYFNAYLL